MSTRRIIVAITGASGALYSKRLLEVLANTPDIETYLIVSPLGRRLLHDELGIDDLSPGELAALAGREDHRITSLPFKDVGASVASGSFKTDSMVIIPCSNNTLAHMAHGLSDNLITRAAQVILKERRRLVVVHREMPLSLIELRNMTQLTEAGAIICPANPGFYTLPKSVDDIVNMVVGRVLDLIDVPHELHVRWNGSTSPVAEQTGEAGEEIQSSIAKPATAAPPEALAPPKMAAPTQPNLPPASVTPAMTPAASTPPAVSAKPAAPQTVPRAPTPAAPITPGPREPLPPLRLGHAAPPAPDVVYVQANRPASNGEPTLADLPLCAQRCRLKAAGARWSADRFAAGDKYPWRHDDEDYSELIAQAKELPDCFLWTAAAKGPSSRDPAAWRRLAGAMDALADALDLFSIDAPAQLASFIRLLAEAQSTVRVAVDQLGAIKADNEQFRAYNWLLIATKQHDIFLERHMRMDEAADPAACDNLRQRIAACAAQARGLTDRDRKRKKALDNLKFKAGRLPGNADELREHWRKMLALVEELTAGGLPHTSRELRDPLTPIWHTLPPDAALGPAAQRLRDEINRAPEAPLVDDPDADDADDPGSSNSPQIEQVAALLRGRTVVLIGGERKPHAIDRLKKAFALDDIDWIETRVHQSIAPCQSHIRRPEVALVLLMIRWSSHSLGEVKTFCDASGKPLVRLPAGYNPNQVATQILEQCGEQLAGLAPAGR